MGEWVVFGLTWKEDEGDGLHFDQTFRDHFHPIQASKHNKVR